MRLRSFLLVCGLLSASLPVLSMPSYATTTPAGTWPSIINEAMNYIGVHTSVSTLYAPRYLETSSEATGNFIDATTTVSKSRYTLFFYNLKQNLPINSPAITSQTGNLASQIGSFSVIQYPSSNALQSAFTNIAANAIPASANAHKVYLGFNQTGNVNMIQNQTIVTWQSGQWHFQVTGGTLTQNVAIDDTILSTLQQSPLPSVPGYLFVNAGASGQQTTLSMKEPQSIVTITNPHQVNDALLTAISTQPYPLAVRTSLSPLLQSTLQKLQGETVIPLAAPSILGLSSAQIGTLSAQAKASYGHYDISFFQNGQIIPYASFGAQGYVTKPTANAMITMMQNYAKLQSADAMQTTLDQTTVGNYYPKLERLRFSDGNFIIDITGSNLVTEKKSALMLLAYTQKHPLPQDPGYLLISLTKKGQVSAGYFAAHDVLFTVTDTSSASREIKMITSIVTL